MKPRDTSLKALAKLGPPFPVGTGLSSVGVPARIMGIGAELATRRLLGRAGLEISPTSICSS
jgi:hypothetical protein